VQKRKVKGTGFYSTVS